MNYLALIIIITTALTGSAAWAVESPKRKSGLWEMSATNTSVKEVQKILICIDEKTDDLMAQQATPMQKNTCTKNELHKDGDNYVGESICTSGGSTATTRVVFTGNFGNAYRADVNTLYQPPIMGMREISLVIGAQWVGPCMPGQKPGDVVIPGIDLKESNELKSILPRKRVND